MASNVQFIVRDNIVVICGKKEQLEQILSSIQNEFLIGTSEEELNTYGMSPYITDFTFTKKPGDNVCYVSITPYGLQNKDETKRVLPPGAKPIQEPPKTAAYLSGLLSILVRVLNISNAVQISKENSEEFLSGYDAAVQSSSVQSSAAQRGKTVVVPKKIEPPVSRSSYDPMLKTGSLHIEGTEEQVRRLKEELNNLKHESNAEFTEIIDGDTKKAQLNITNLTKADYEAFTACVEGRKIPPRVVAPVQFSRQQQTHIVEVPIGDTKVETMSPRGKSPKN